MHEDVQVNDSEAFRSTLMSQNFWTRGTSNHNPYEMTCHIFICTKSISPREPTSEFRTTTPDGAWLTAEEYEARSTGQPCGLCMRLWSDYAWLKGISRPAIRIPREVTNIMTDVRSRRCVFVSHCLLAQGVMAQGVVRNFPGGRAA